MYYKVLATGAPRDTPREDRLTLFVAGDDLEAKTAVSRLIEEIGFAAVDTGSLRAGGLRQQPGSRLYNAPMAAREALALLQSGA